MRLDFDDCFSGILLAGTTALIIIAIVLMACGVCFQEFEGYYLSAYNGKANIFASWKWDCDYRVGGVLENQELWQWIQDNGLHLKVDAPVNN